MVGATDFYKATLEPNKELYYYDVNSLYPKAMLNPMPYEILKFYPDMTFIKLDDFFGFCLAEIECPEDIKIPLLPHKYNNKTIFPTGKWIAIYFSEELKAVASHGYKITLIKGYQFSKINYFEEYVEHFFNNKKRN